MSNKIIDKINAIKAWLISYQPIRTEFTDIVKHVSSTSQQSPRDVLSVKNVGKAFDMQKEQIDARALKSHRIDCDVFDCKNDKCFIWEPDNVVAYHTISRKRGAPDTIISTTTVTKRMKKRKID